MTKVAGRCLPNIQLLLNDNNAGKREDIYLMIDRRAYAPFATSTGDRRMLEYSKAGDGERLAMSCCMTMPREYAYGPAQELLYTTVATSLRRCATRRKQNWIVISMKSDWKRIFTFEK